MARPRWGFIVGGFVAVLAFGLIGPAAIAAAGADWTLTAAPLSLTFGSSSTIDVSVTGGSTPIGRIEVQVAASDTVNGATLTAVPAGLAWTAQILPGNREVVALVAAGDPDRLSDGQTITVAIDVTSTATRSEAWKVSAYRGETASSGHDALGSQSITGIAVTGAPKPTPKPTPTPRPTPTPTPRPTPTPTPVATSTPTPTPRPTPTPSHPGGPGSTPPAATPTAGTGGTIGLGGTGHTPGSPPPIGAPGGLTVASDVTSANGSSAAAVMPTVRLGDVSLGSSLKWLLPTVALSVPGAIIVGAVAIQLVTGLTFVELTRRRLGAFFLRRRVEVATDR